MSEEQNIHEEQSGIGNEQSAMSNRQSANSNEDISQQTFEQTETNQTSEITTSEIDKNTSFHNFNFLVKKIKFFHAAGFRTAVLPTLLHKDYEAQLHRVRLRRHRTLLLSVHY